MAIAGTPSFRGQDRGLHRSGAPAGQVTALPDSRHLDRIDRATVVTEFRTASGIWQVSDHAHRKAQLLFTTAGVVTMETAAGIWAVPPQRALWIPGGMPHKAHGSGSTHGFALLVEPDAAPGLPTACSALAVSPLMQALLERAATIAIEYPENSAEARLMAVLLDELIAAPLAEFCLPMPRDHRLRLIADHLLTCPSELTRLAEWAHRIGMSERSMTRLFQSETGLSIGQWRRRMHVVLAVQRLGAGQSIQAVAFDLGYDTTGGFAMMFRKATGAPPGQFVAERAAAFAGGAGFALR